MSPEHILEASGFDIYGPLKVADFGANAGYFTIPIAKRLSADASTVYAFDIQEAPLETLRKRARELHIHNIQTIRADLERPGGTQMKDESMDRVLMANILFQAPDKNTLVAEAVRILHPNGKILVIDWDPDHAAGLGPKKDQRVSRATTTQILMHLGCRVRKEMRVGTDHYAILATKS